jgi:hypothetical protein
VTVTRHSYENGYEVQLLVTSYKREIVVVEPREQSKVEPGVQKNMGGWPVRI